MRDYFVFDGVSSTDFDAYLFDKSTYETPAKTYNLTPIPGRNGNILLSQHRFEDVTMSYTILFTKNFRRNYDRLRSFLLSRDGYCRLSDTFHEDEFYSAYYADVMQPTITDDRNMGKMILRFQRRAERYLVEGERVQTFNLTSSSATATITNPTQFAAKPLIRINGSREMTINGTHFETVSTSTSTLNHINIDCEIMECYNDTKTTDLNTSFVLLGNALDFPTLSPGENTITLNSSDSTELRITPRWWTL